MRALIALLVPMTLAAPALAEVTRHQTPRADGSPIHWTLDAPQVPAGLIVLAQGSGCLGSDINYNLGQARAAFADFAALRVEKHSVLPDDAPENDHLGCGDDFYAHHTVGQRIADYQVVLADLPRMDGPVVLFGGSEGGPVIAALAAQGLGDAVIMFSTAPGVSFGEMVRASIPPEGQAQADAAFAAARAAPDSDEIWAGTSYRYWADALDRRALDDMLRADVPFLLVQGGRDGAAPVMAARVAVDAFAAAGRCNLTYWEFPGLDHALIDMQGRSHLAATIAQARFWADATLASEPGPAPEPGPQQDCMRP